MPETEQTSVEAAPKQDAQKLQRENRELAECRWGFLFLATFILLLLANQLIDIFNTYSEMQKESVVRPTTRWTDCLFPIGSTLFSLFPAGIILARRSRSVRWQYSAFSLLVVAVLNIILTAVVDINLAKLPVDAPTPLPLKIAGYALLLLVWLIYWLMIVLVAEFAIACKNEEIIERCEWNGYAVFVGGSLLLGLAAWMLPSTSKQDSVDEMTILLDASHGLAFIVCSFWTMKLCTLAAALARHLIEKSTEAIQAFE